MSVCLCVKYEERRKDDLVGMCARVCVVCVSKKRLRERERGRKRGERVLMQFSLSVDWTGA